MTFQDKIKESLKTSEELLREQQAKEEEYFNSRVLWKVEDIRKDLIKSAENAQYIRTEDKTMVFCYHEISQKYLMNHMESNIKEILENEKRFFLFRDKNLEHRKWMCFYINPEKITAYQKYCDAIKKEAAKDNINIEFVLYNSENDCCYNLPCTIPREENPYGMKLVAKASVEI